MVLDGTEERKDSSQVTVDTSSAPKGTLTEKTPETFTKEMVDKVVSDALSKVGRDAKSLTEREQRLAAGLAELVAKQAADLKKQEEAEEWDLRDQPEELAAKRAERRKKAADEAKVTEFAEREVKAAEREAKLALRETELADIVEQHRILTRTQLAAEVAVEKGVSMDAILKLAKADTREAYEEVAAVLPPAKEPHVLLPASGRTNRGGIDLSSLSPKERMQEREKRLRTGTK